MKPISLRLQAFGPFRDEVFIDFENFNNKGLFLLTGNTGAGKTSIFDAISFALYDTLSGNTRSKENVRSDYASPSVKTFVELRFIHNNKEYFITRQPSYLRDGYKSKTIADASIEFDNKTVTGSTNVTKEVISILGIDAKQFKQIAMIAQGEFQNLLFASSNDRTTIFRNIFDTYVFSKVSEVIKNKFLKIKRIYNDKTLIFNNEVANIEWDLEIAEDEDVLECLKNHINEDKVEVLKLNKRIDFLTNNVALLNTKLNLAILDNKNIDALEEKTKVMESMKMDYNKFLEINKEIEEQRKLIPLVENKISLDNSLKEAFKAYDQIESDMIDATWKFSNIKSEFSTIDKLKEELNIISKTLDIIDSNKLINDKINNIKLIKPVCVDLERLKFLEDKTSNNDIQSCYEKEKLIYNNDQEELKKLIVSLDEIINNENVVNKKNEEFLSLQGELNKLSEEVNNLENILLNNKAAYLASKLESGQACMVCGSKSHPNPALKLADVSIEELNAKKDKKQKLQTKNDELFNSIYALNSLIKNSNKDKIVENIKSLESKKYKLEEYKLEYENYLECVKDLELMRKQVKKFDEDNLVYNNNLATIKTLESSLVKVDKIYTKHEYESLNKRINDINSDYNSSLIELNKLDNEFKNTKKNIDMFMNNLKEVRNKIGSRDVWSKELFDERVKSSSEYFENFNKVEVILNDLIDRTKDKEKVDTEELENSLISNKEELQNIDKSIILRYNNNKNIYNRLVVIRNENIELEKVYSTYKILSDTANGTINGKAKVNFEQFVQSYYFDEVIKNSNIRLNDITQGRYQLVKKNDANLELDVIDYYTGKTRCVKTLSGGEVFKSSLALALGMSDTIGAYAGGIKIDTLFIDEGFGSLDSDSLESAIKTLTELSNDKLIGIISHVEELKSRIDKKIIVTKSNSGSTVSIEN